MRTGPTPQAWKRSVGTVDRIETLPVLLIVTFRPEFDAAVGRTVACDEL